MDWTKTGYSYDIIVGVVHQTNVDKLLGVLSGVQFNGLQMTDNYYSDSRVQAKVTTIVKDGTSDGYVANARLRITLVIPDRGWSKEMFTGYVTDVQETHEHGYVKRSYTLDSTMWGLLDHKMYKTITIADKAKLIDTWKDILSKNTKMQYSTSGANNHTFALKSPMVYPIGTALSTILFELTSKYDRMNVDGHGRITLKKYIAPSSAQPSRTLDLDDARGLIYGSVSRSSDEVEKPGQVVVTANITQNEKQKTISSRYTAPSTHATSIEKRGWLSVRVEAYNGSKDNPTNEDLATVAKTKWQSAQANGVEWSLSSVFADYWAGEVVNLIVNNKTHKCLIKSVSTNFENLTQDLTLKEV